MKNEENKGKSFFLKLNMVSALFALLPFIGIELMANVYRISRLTGVEIGKVSTTIDYGIVAGIIVTVIMFIWLIKGPLNGRLVSFVSVLLWIPYFVAYVFLFVTLLSITDPADDPNPATGLIAIAALLIYPFYLAGICAIGTFRRWGR